LCRAVLAAAVVAAVLLMHGPSGALGGCSGGEPARTPGAAVAMLEVTDVVVMSQTAAVAIPGQGGHAAVCVSLPPRPGRSGLLALLALAVVLATIVPAASPLVATFARRRRAPPVFGAALLYQLCVSRT
jgi:hypothetical protein